MDLKKITAMSDTLTCIRCNKVICNTIRLRAERTCRRHNQEINRKCIMYTYIQMSVHCARMLLLFLLLLLLHAVHSWDLIDFRWT